jgi:O-antigen/teichoic acid export membrane protein
MTTLRRLFRNTSVLIVANALQPVLSFYLIVTISRVLEVEGLGAYATVFNYQAIFQIFAAFGLRNLLTRNVAQQPEAIWRYVWHGSLIVLPFSFLSIAGLIALTAFLQYIEVVFWATIIVSASLIAAALVEVCEGALAGLERLHIVGYSAVLENVLRVGASLLLLGNGHGLLALAWVFVASRYIRAVFYYWYIHRLVSPRPLFGSAGKAGKFTSDWAFARQLIRQAPVFALTMICVTVYWKVDISILSKARGLEDVGLYSAAFRFLMLALVVVDSFVNSLFPIISNYYRRAAANGSSGQFEVACKKGLQLLLVLTVPVALALSLLADQIILLVYGEKYIGAVPALRILIWVVVPYAISQIFAYALVASNNQRYDLFVNAVSMVCNIILNWILIQKFGYIGAAWAAAVSILIYVAVQVPFVFRSVLTFDGKRLLFGGVKIVAATALMAGFILFFAQIKIWFLIPLALFIYLLTLVAARTFSRNDWLLATRLMK